MSNNVLNLPGDYKIVANRNGGLVWVSANSRLGVTTATNIIESLSTYAGDIIPTVSTTWNLGSGPDNAYMPDRHWRTLNVDQIHQYGMGGEFLNKFDNDENVANSTHPYAPFTGDNGPDSWMWDGLYDTTLNRQMASVYVAGGVGIEKDLNVGGHIYGRIEFANTTTYVVFTNTNVDFEYNLSFVNNEGVFDTESLVYIDTEGVAAGLTYNPAYGRITTDRMLVAETDMSTSTSTGALVVNGGVGVAGTMTIGGSVLPAEDVTGRIGNTATQWAEAYVHDIYTRLIASTTGTIEIKPYAGVTDIFGDIRVRGANPIGTAPVVTNVLYVTMDGNDTNDGRAMDPSRACRTIGAALNSPYYQSGTQIRVAPGHYLEDNPLQLKPYTSIMGSDLRTCSVEPINKTQDLFHLNSGCYLAFMQFLNGRSGLLEGAYTPGTNRGAYCTSFPPLEGDDRIDLFHSPYIQNCTNLSGPWLKDGTMFVPNQTVQIPSGVATGTWPAGATTIVVTPTLGSIKQGDTINAGQQNIGFFNARTLMLINKGFIQEQVVAYIDQQIATNVGNVNSIWWNTATNTSFTYSREFCFRDVGILVENVSYDAAFGGNEKAVESGLAYYNGVVSKIAGQELQTTEAINYINTLTQNLITGNSTPDLLGATKKYQRFFNYALTDGGVAGPAIQSLFDTITGIIVNGPTTAPDVYKSTGPDAAFVSAETLMQANRTFIQENTLNYVNRFLSQKPFPYNEIKCKRDTGLIIDSIAGDLLYPTVDYSQSTFAGLQYWSRDGYTGAIATEITTTTAAINYLKDLSVKIIQNITPADDLVDRFFTPTVSIYQDLTVQSGTANEVSTVKTLFTTLTDILSGKNTNWTDTIVSNGDPSSLTGVIDSVQILQNNKEYIKEEVNAYVWANGGLSFQAYNSSTCKRDVGFIVDSISFDLLHGGNRQSVQSAVYYFGVSNTQSNIATERTQTVDAFNYLSTIAGQVIQNIPVTALQSKVEQTFGDTPATASEATIIDTANGIITNIITNGPSVVANKMPISLTASTDPNVINAYDILTANKKFLVAQTIAYINNLFNPGSFNYDQELCYRDTGLIIDAVSQDILLGGNYKSVEAGLAYWNFGYNQVAGQETTTTMALNYARDIALQVIANIPVTVQTGTVSTQVINPFFQYGGDYMPQEAVTRNFGIITDIIQKGPLYAPPRYMGGGLFALTGINGADVKIPPTVSSVEDLLDGTFLVGLSQPTVGFGNNATLYFGDTLIFPKQDAQVDSYVETDPSLGGLGLPMGTWDSRKVDPIGGMGGSLVDGAVISARSPIQSFVYDAFTQLTQGGRGVHITNDGYAQLVSVFTIFASIGVQTDNGGIASIVNSNANFGDICLLSKGHGKRAFSGTIYNPAFKAYPDDPEFNPYYPNGFWPNNGRVRVFVPDLDDRPHISLIMEIIPPEGHTNEQSFPGFLNASPTTSTLTSGTITISNIVTDGIAVGNSVYARDQYGSEIGPHGLPYIATGTVVTDVNYNSITLNIASTDGGTDPTNDYVLGYINNNYFDLYFCGNSYYTVLSSETGENPKTVGINILSAAATVDDTDQIAAHIDALRYLNTITNLIISNQTVPILQTTSSQYIDPLVQGGAAASTFIDLRFGEIISIIGAGTLEDAEGVIKPVQRTKTGPTVQGAGSAITLITENLQFMADQVSTFVNTLYPTLAYSTSKCRRDVGLIMTRIMYDIASGGRYNSVFTGLSYWSRNGTHRIVQLGENVTRTDLFPDGANVNFYQRSYISASGYVFEYVGAGTNYGALPQRGIADPVQTKEVVQLDNGKVFFTSTDQNGDFRIGPGLVISQATGVLSGRTFTKSLFANMTPFILAIEGGAL
jgi:hypothetical protein